MTTVLISGWATDSRIWDRVLPEGPETVRLCWTSLLEGELHLPDPCILVGWSLGGQLALDLSGRPEVCGLVLVSGMTCLSKNGARPGQPVSARKDIQALISRSRRGYLRSFFAGCGAEGDDLAMLIGMSEQFSDSQLRTGLDRMFLHCAEPYTEIPSVIIHGTCDGIVPFLTAEYLKAVLGDKATLLPVSGAGHLVPLQHPETVLKGVKSLAAKI